jgi:AcrR family transcriptional regulator
VTAEPLRLDRRQRRRLETIEEIVDVAIEVMTEHGVGGLSLGEVARRMDMRTPSLYVYFDSKNAVYDAVFTRGWHDIHAVMAPQYAKIAAATDLPRYFLESGQLFLRWMLEHPVHAQLMSWRPVPGYQPSADAYAAAVDLLADSQASFAELQRRGLFRAELDPELLLRTWTTLMSGVMTQQLANAPHEPFDTGRFTSTLPAVAAMFLAHYGTATRTRQRAQR